MLALCKANVLGNGVETKTRPRTRVLVVEVIKYIHLYHTRWSKTNAVRELKQMLCDFRLRRISSYYMKWEYCVYEAGDMGTAS